MFKKNSMQIKRAIRVVLATIYNIIYSCILCFVTKPRYKKKYNYVICAIFKDEAPFLKEWIEYHLMLGFEHIYMYNNKSSDRYNDILNPYIVENKVTLIDWPYDQSQILAYQNYYEVYRNEAQWVSFLDIDEFFCPKYKNSIGEWLKEYERYPVVLIYWKMFGSSGRMKHDYQNLVIEQYNVSWDYLYHVGKCLINTDYDIVKYDASTHHAPMVYFFLGKFRLKIPPINVFKKFIMFDIHFTPKRECQKATMQINHYWSKAWDIFDAKRRRTDVFFKDNPKKNLDYYYYHEHKNRVSDYQIYRFLIQLKLRLKLYE